MTQFFQQVANFLVPVFVVSTMLNVGLTQRPTKILGHLKNWHYLVRISVLNLLVVPAIMYFALALVELDPVFEIGLLLFAMSSGAPLLIKFAVDSQNDVALGATVMMVQMVATLLILPILLPRLVEGVEVLPGLIAFVLVTRMLLPIVVGMAARQFLDRIVAVIQPYVARLSAISLYVMIAATLIGYATWMIDLQLWKSVLVSVAVFGIAFMLGYMMGDGEGHLKEIGGLSSAQRNTAAALIVASTNFAHEPGVFVIVNIINTLGIIILIAAAKSMGKGKAQVCLLEPLAADPSSP